MFSPLRATINFFQHVIIYIAKVMGLLHANRVQRKVRYFIHYSHRDIELDYESDIDEFESHESFSKSWLIRESYLVLNFLCFKFFNVFKEHIVNCIRMSWRKCLNWFIYILKHYFTNRGVIIKNKMGCCYEVGTPSLEVKGKIFARILTFSAFSFKTVACTMMQLNCLNILKIILVFISFFYIFSFFAVAKIVQYHNRDRIS